MIIIWDKMIEKKILAIHLLNWFNKPQCTQNAMLTLTLFSYANFSIEIWMVHMGTTNNTINFDARYNNNLEFTSL